MDPKSTILGRYIFLNHGDDNELSKNGHCRFFASIDLEGNIIRSEDIDVDDDKGLKRHLAWRFLFYNASSAGECRFYQKAIGRLLQMDTQKANSPTVFIHRGGQELKEARMVTDWRHEHIKKESIDSNLADQLATMRAVGIPMSRGDSESTGWSYSFINWYDNIVYRLADGQDFMRPDILFRDLASASKSAQAFYGAIE